MQPGAPAATQPGAPPAPPANSGLTQPRRPVFVESLPDLGIVVISGDNGRPFPRCKANLYDGGTRQPLAIRWPAKLKGGKTIDDFVNLYDLAPTFLDAAGLKVPKDMAGQSLLPLLAGKGGWTDQREVRFYGLCMIILFVLLGLLLWDWRWFAAAFLLLAGIAPALWRLLV